MLTRREPQDGRLDVRGQLAPLEHAEPTAVLGRARVLGILAREIAEVLAREHAAVDLVGPAPRRRPAVLARAGPGHEEDVAGPERQGRPAPFPGGGPRGGRSPPRAAGTPGTHCPGSLAPDAPP